METSSQSLTPSEENHQHLLSENLVEQMSDSRNDDLDMSLINHPQNLDISSLTTKKALRPKRNDDRNSVSYQKSEANHEISEEPQKSVKKTVRKLNQKVNKKE